jgi:peptide deformylase
MAKLDIIIAPDPRLKAKAKPVDQVDDRIVKLMDDMLETMYTAPGIGLAAPQVGVLERVLVVDIAGKGEPPQPVRMVNPEIVWQSDGLATYNEGCLSFPDQYADVTRPAEARIRYIDENNQPQELDAKGLLATCVQHEIDHLEGVLFIDHLSSLKRNIVLRKLSKWKKAQKAA